MNIAAVQLYHSHFRLVGGRMCDSAKPCIINNRVIRGVTNHWTGLLDSKFTHKVSFPAQFQPPKAIVSPHLKQCPSVGHQDIYLVQCNLSIVATPRHQTNCRGALGR